VDWRYPALPHASAPAAGAVPQVVAECRAMPRRPEAAQTGRYSEAGLRVPTAGAAGRSLRQVVAASGGPLPWEEAALGPVHLLIVAEQAAALE